LNAPVLKTGIGGNLDRGFESHPRRSLITQQCPLSLATTTQPAFGRIRENLWAGSSIFL
jgi:hypothetical protein